jgi:hypothetical protein
MSNLTNNTIFGITLKMHFIGLEPMTRYNGGIMNIVKISPIKTYFHQLIVTNSVEQHGNQGN